MFKLGEENTVGANSRVLLSDNTIWWTGSMDDAVRHTGPFDPQLPVLAFRGADDKLRAVLFNHSTHTIGTRTPGVRSPSFYGLAAQELEAELGCPVEFLEGASGSTHNITAVPVDEAVRRMKRAVTEALWPRPSRTRSRDWCRSSGPSSSRSARSTNRSRTKRCRAIAASASRQPCRRRDRRVPRHAAEAQADSRARRADTVLQAIAIGDVAIVGVPAEYFTIFGVDIKRRSPFPNTVVAELANDWIGYLPNLEAHEFGGYQTWMGLHSYAEPGTGERVADAVVSMLEELAKP